MLESTIPKFLAISLLFIASCTGSNESTELFIETFEKITINESEQLKALLENDRNHFGGRVTSSDELLETKYGTLRLDQIIERISSPEQIEPNYSIKLIPPDYVKGTIEYLIIEYRDNEYYSYILQYEPTGAMFNMAQSLDSYSGIIRTLHLDREIRSKNYYENGKLSNPENGRTTTFTNCDCNYDYRPVYGPVTGEIIGYDTWILCTCSDGTGGGGTTDNVGGNTGSTGSGDGESTNTNTGTGGNNGSSGNNNSSDTRFPVGLDSDTCVFDEEGNCVEEEECLVSKDDLQNAFPNASEATLTALEENLNKYGKDFGIDTKEKMQHFLAQAGHESTNYAGKEFGTFKENLNYRWEKLGTEGYWNDYFNPISDPLIDPNKANPYDFIRSSNSSYVNKEKFANYVYNDANRSSKGALGNTSIGDGYKYRGRGIIQLTGRNNYTAFNEFYRANFDSSIDLLSNPNLISSDTDIAVISALWFFENNVLDIINIDGSASINKVTQLVNGGKNGLKHRKKLFDQTKANINCI